MTNLKILFKEKYLFYVILLFNILLILTVKFYPSMDGPAHLQNSNLLKHLLTGNSQLNEYFVINTLPVPNWLSHFILSSLLFIFPAFIAEKILLIFYIAGMAVSFRLLIRYLNPSNVGLSIFIFPFVYTLLFHMGFYNFSISFIFMFYSIYYVLKTYNNEGVKKYIIISLLLTLTYFSNILTYFFLGLILGLIILSNEVLNINLDVKRLLRRLVLLLISALPSLIMLFIFLNISFNTAYFSYSKKELIQWLQDVRPLIVYDYPGEVILTRFFLFIMIAIFTISMYLRFKEISKFSFYVLNTYDFIFSVPILLSLVMLFLIPDGSGAGMMSHRFILIFYILIMTWLIIQPVPKKIVGVLIFVIIITHIGLQLKRMNGSIRKLDKHAREIVKTANFIEEYSLVLPINISGDYNEIHFGNYLGIEKPLIILENYEASVGWFPVKWDGSKIPNILAGDKNEITNTIPWFYDINSKKKVQIDYIFLHGGTENLADPKWVDLNKILNCHFEIQNNSESKYFTLYKKK